MRITVITAITKNKDKLREDFPPSKAEYIAFLDKETEDDVFISKLWDIQPAYDLFKEPRRNAKIHKVMPHLFIETDISIWLDANISLNITPEKLVEKWLIENKDITTWKHFARECLFEEGLGLLDNSYDKQEFIIEQLKTYKRKEYPFKAGLSECNVIVRRHTPEMAILNEGWWAQICRYSSRDQISFPYVFREKVHRIEGNPRIHPDFNYRQHNFVEKNYARDTNI